ncbi:hypothetical protein L596_015790 [Steinernema carpocapsae]|uniref:Uncharacterized protein n=1 Tax=Steinernema carpocapsae TaxID=34508 RepID=A0A4V6A361_STECR|nr:hypothetical protein L596_015790 [Steinernema carpocapsae]
MDQGCVTLAHRMLLEHFENPLIHLRNKKGQNLWKASTFPSRLSKRVSNPQKFSQILKKRGFASITVNTWIKQIFPTSTDPKSILRDCRIT